MLHLRTMSHTAIEFAKRANKNGLRRRDSRVGQEKAAQLREDYLETNGRNCFLCREPARDFSHLINGDQDFMDMHHFDPKGEKNPGHQKKFNVSRKGLSNHRLWESVDELIKTVPVHKDCHQAVHSNRGLFNRIRNKATERSTTQLRENFAVEQLGGRATQGMTDQDALPIKPEERKWGWLI